MGAAAGSCMAAAFGRPGAASNSEPGSCAYVRPAAADGSCAGPLSNFTMGAANFVGAATQPLPAAANFMGAASELHKHIFANEKLQPLPKFDTKCQIFAKIN